MSKINIMDIHPQILIGHWRAGYTLDLHTVSSTPKEWTTKKITYTEFIDGEVIIVEKEVPDKVTKWETVYTEIGNEMYHLKYWRERFRALTIGECAANFLQTQLANWEINLIVPIPPSDTTREFQPVYEIVNHIGRLCNLQIDFTLLKKLKPTSQLKEIDDPTLRKEVLQGAFFVEKNSLSGRNVLLFDDLYRSGETLNAVSDIILNQGKAKNVYALTITKTRTKR